VPQAIRLPPENPSTPKRENAEGKENARAEYVIGPILEQHLEHEDQEGVKN